jgi:exosortase K
VRAFRIAVPAGDVAVAGVALGTAWALKVFYSTASFDQLRWILTPTVWLVRLSTGVALEMEAHRGYLSRDQLFLVAPACAGVNFLIVTFVSLCLGLASACSRAGERVALVLASAAAAYAATVLANAARIALALRLHEAGASFGPLTPARLHCAVGVAVYFLFLLALLAGAERVMPGRRAPA